MKVSYNLFYNKRTHSKQPRSRESLCFWCHGYTIQTTTNYSNTLGVQAIQIFLQARESKDLNQEKYSTVTVRSTTVSQSQLSLISNIYIHKNITYIKKSVGNNNVKCSIRIIITTPEKWDMLTRRWRDHRGLVEVIKLFLIDEVHILNDETRGPVLEAVVSRMKTIEVGIIFAIV